LADNIIETHERKGDFKKLYRDENICDHAIALLFLKLLWDRWLWSHNAQICM